MFSIQKVVFITTILCESMAYIRDNFLKNMKTLKENIQTKKTTDNICKRRNRYST